MVDLIELRGGVCFLYFDLMWACAGFGNEKEMSL